VKILVITNLYPPHHAGTFDLRCEAVVNNLKLRGHQLHILTSTHGMNQEQQGGEVERRLLLNGTFDHPLVTSYNELKGIEVQNHQVLRETLVSAEPDIVLVFSLYGLSKSLLFALRHVCVPVVFDVADSWMTLEVANDPWLRWWNHPAMNMARKAGQFISGATKVDAAVRSGNAIAVFHATDAAADGVRKLDQARKAWELGSDAGPETRRANVLVSGIDLRASRGRVLRIGGTRVRVAGEVKPCERMEEAVPGLRASMFPEWRGGAFAEIIEGGLVAVGDAVAWDDQ